MPPITTLDLNFAEWNASVSRKHISEALINRYTFDPFLSNDYVLFHADENICGHQAADLIARNDLTGIFKTGNYHEHPLVPCLFQHNTNGVIFTLVVDNCGVIFTLVVDNCGIKSQHINDLNHPIATINQKRP